MVASILLILEMSKLPSILSPMSTFGYRSYKVSVLNHVSVDFGSHGSNKQITTCAFCPILVVTPKNFIFISGKCQGYMGIRESVCEQQVLLFRQR